MRIWIFFYASLIISTIYNVGETIAPKRGLRKFACVWTIFAGIALVLQIFGWR